MAVTLFNQLLPASTLTFDNHDFVQVSPSSRVTEHPVEGGSDVADHIQVLGTEFVIRGRISDTVIALSPEPGRVEAALAFFDQNRTALLTAVTARSTFTNLLLIGFPYTENILRNLVWDVRLRQITIASAVSVPIPPRQPVPPVQTGSSTGQDAGSQATSDAAPPPDTSLLQTAADIFSGLGG